MALDKLTVERIAKMHPKVREEVLEMYTYVNEKLLGKGVRLRFAYTTRTKQEQTDLYALGRRKKGSKVTNAQWYQTFHFESYGLAFDIVLLYDLDGNGTFETASWDMKKDFDNDKIADWMEVTNYFKSKGWDWGGDWKFKDAPHFEKVFNNKWQDLKLKYDNKEFIEGTQYVKI